MRQKIGRLALRHEGDFWNAYYAMPDTMEGAIFLGCVAIAAVQDQARKAAFMDLMRSAVGQFIEEQTGGNVTWPDSAQRAPEHERSGHA